MKKKKFKCVRCGTELAKRTLGGYCIECYKAYLMDYIA